MKTAKLHFCDGKGYEMKVFYITGKYYVCPMCGFTVEDGKKTKGVLTERRKDNGMAKP